MRRIMRHVTSWRLATLTALALTISTAHAQVGYDSAYHHGGQNLEVRLWTHGDPETVYLDGDRVDLRFRTTDDAYVVIYGVDVDGMVHLLYPTHPRHRRHVRGGRTYRVRGPFLDVSGSAGIVHVEALASHFPLEPHLPAFFYARHRARPYRWGNGSGLVLRYGIVTGDPYLRLARLRSAIVPAGCASWHMAHTTIAYRVGHAYDYPRYLCADCHYGGWYDPYDDACSAFDIRVDWMFTNTFHYRDTDPRYYYWRRASAPVRYRSHKTRWSSKDGPEVLGRYFAGRTGRERSLVADGTVSWSDKPVLDRPDRGRPRVDNRNRIDDRTRADDRRRDRPKRDRMDDERADRDDRSDRPPREETRTRPRVKEDRADERERPDRGDRATDRRKRREPPERRERAEDRSDDDRSASKSKKPRKPRER